MAGNWDGNSAWDSVARDAFAILVLARSLGGVCLLDSDGDGLCDVEDNCPHTPNRINVIETMMAWVMSVTTALTCPTEIN